MRSQEERVPEHNPPSYATASSQFHDRSSAGQGRADSALRWGVSPGTGAKPGAKAHEMPPDHPVHKMSAAEQAKLVKKGINPVLKAEMYV